MLLLWVLNRNSSPPNILDKPAQSALTLKINFEELEYFAMENHGGCVTILSFASNKNACNTEKEGLIFYGINSPIVNTPPTPIPLTPAQHWSIVQG